MLLLTFRVAESAYAVDTEWIVEVIPWVELRAIPHAPAALAGLFTYRGQVVPVVDTGLLLGASAARPLLSTRIILVAYPRGDRTTTLLGLLAEQVSDVRRVGDRPPGCSALHLEQARYLGPVVPAEDGLVQLIAVDEVLPEPLRAALFAAMPEPS
jgi:chemotaxis-related protein WspB